MRLTVLITLGLFTWGTALMGQTLWLDELDLSKVETGWGVNQRNRSVDGNTLSVGGVTYERGIGTHAVSKILLNLKGRATRFTADAGVDDEAGDKASIEFFIMGDKRMLWKSGLMKKGDKAKEIRLLLTGVQKLALLVTDGGDNIDYDHADWLNARIEYSRERPELLTPPGQEPYILTPLPPVTPRINGPGITGARPGHDFLFAIPVTGARPVQYEAEGLPPGLSIDKETGVITGRVSDAGEYTVKLRAVNGLGEASRDLKIVIGDRLALTPPLGWNSWNCWGLSVSDDHIRAAADAMVSSGLTRHGWTYINIDDGWEAPQRAENGRILSNEKFPDMKELSDYVHDRGLKLGIYSSPGDKTCGGYLGSYGHERQDAETWSEWGIDYLKYDWCSYSNYAKDKSPGEYMKPYVLMYQCFDSVDRDIVYSLCQYGMSEVWTWGGSVGGNCWRTTGDITDSWGSMSDIGFSQDRCSPYAGPGHWNDPDMLVVGKVGWGPSLRQTRLTPDEQYTHISLWSLLAAPLLIGCDMSQLDGFTLSLLSNDEVLAVNQDPLGKQARRLTKENGNEVWLKELEDGAYALGIFYNRSHLSGPVSQINWENEVMTKRLGVEWDDLGLTGPFAVRDIWRHVNLGVFDKAFSADIRWHGVRLLKLTPVH